MNKNTAPTTAIAEADEVRHLTVAEAEALPGMLGRIASSMLRLRGWYGYRTQRDGREIKVMLLAK